LAEFARFLPEGTKFDSSNPTEELVEMMVDSVVAIIKNMQHDSE